MSTKPTQRTDDERKSLLDQVHQLRGAEDISLASACKKVGINLSNYYGWSKKKGKGKRKYRRRKPVLVTSLVPSEPSRQSDDVLNDLGHKPSARQVAEMLAIMNARSLRALLSEG